MFHVVLNAPMQKNNSKNTILNRVTPWIATVAIVLGPISFVIADIRYNFTGLATFHQKRRQQNVAPLDSNEEKSTEKIIENSN